MNNKKTSIIFTGDIGFDRHMTDRFRDPDLISNEILGFFHGADHVVANVEGALFNIDANSGDLFFHAINPEAVNVLDAISADIWSIGNNHIMDAGENGLCNTLRIADEMGRGTVGAGRNRNEASSPVILDGAGGIGIFCAAYQPDCIPATDDSPGSFSWDDYGRIANVISSIKKDNRWCIMVVHGGEEFTSLPMPYTRARYMRYLELGADIVVAHHPHVAENYELFDNNKAIFYSLGNFIFDTDYQRAQHNTDAGVLLKLVLCADGFEFIPFGTRIVRGPETVEAGPVPAIFTDIPAREYEALVPLAAKVFIEAEKKRMIFMEPKQYGNAAPEEWKNYFFSGTAEGYVPNEHMDFSVVTQIAADDKETWKESGLEAVKDYLLRQL